MAIFNKKLLICLMLVSVQTDFAAGGCLAWLFRRREASLQTQSLRAVQMTPRLTPAILNPLDGDIYHRSYQSATTTNTSNLQAFIVYQSDKEVQLAGDQAVETIEALRKKGQILSEGITVCPGHPSLITIYTTI